MKLYAGIDLHSNNSMVAIIDEQDRVVLQKRFANALQQILLALASFKEHLARGGGRVDLQLVLAGRWVDGSRLHGAFGQHGGDRAVRGTEVQRR